MSNHLRNISQNNQGLYVENADSVVQNNYFINSNDTSAISFALSGQSDNSCWEQILFSNQVGLEHAIMGYRLLPSDAKSCPKLPQFNLAKNKLDTAHYVFIIGEPGCGKSITAYQLAFEYHIDGWTVLKLSNENGNNLHLDSYVENVIFVIDDAQLFSKSIITQLMSESNKSKKLIVTQTTSNHTSQDTVILLNRQAVEAIYEHYLTHKSDIINLVVRLNKDSGRYIGDTIGYSSFEFALNIAKKEKTPWLFNYSLRGGWGNSSYLFDLAKENDRADIILILLSLKQILSLDKPVEIQWLHNSIKNFKYQTDWVDHQLSFLCNQKLVTSISEIRAIHLQMAYCVVVRFYETASHNEQDIFTSIIQNEILNTHTSLMGAVWLYNGLSGHNITYRFFETVFTDNFCQALFNRCLEQETSEERKHAAFTIERIINQRLLMHEIVKDNSIIIKWINSVDSITAYAYSRILNTINNNKSNEGIKTFIATLDLYAIMNHMKQINRESLYEWASFLDRLTCFYYQKRGSEITGLLPKEEIHLALMSVEYDYLFGAFEMLCSLVHNDPTFTFQEYYVILPKIIDALNHDFKGTIEKMELRFVMYIFGYILSGQSRPDKFQKKAASDFSKNITSNMLARYIDTGTPHDWRRLYYIWILVSKYNNNATKDVMANIDLSSLDNATTGMWENQEHEFILMLDMLYDSNKHALDDLIYCKRDVFNDLSMPLAGISLRTTEHVFRKGGKINLVWKSHITWEISASVVSEINKFNNGLCLDIIEQNKTDILEALINLSFTDCNNFHFFINALIKVNPEILNEMFSDNAEISRIKNTWHKNLKSERFYSKPSKERKGFESLLKLMKGSVRVQGILELLDDFIDISRIVSNPL